MYALFNGFVYTPGEQTECSDDILENLAAWINLVDIGEKVYLPYNWPNFQVASQDVIVSVSDLIAACDMNELFTTLTTIFTSEGIAEFGARIAGAAAFQISDFIGAVNDETISTQEKARRLGKVMSAILNYYIS